MYQVCGFFLSIFLFFGYMFVPSSYSYSCKFVSDNLSIGQPLVSLFGFSMFLTNEDLPVRRCVLTVTWPTFGKKTH